MNVTFPCPNCGQASRTEVTSDTDTLDCGNCGRSIKLPARTTGQVERCLACPSRDLFVRKDFPQRLGVTIVVIGIAASTVAWGMSEPLWTYAILFATALVDLVLYLTMPDALMCYRCGATYRNVSLAEHGPFELETHERYRQQAARLGEHTVNRQP